MQLQTSHVGKIFRPGGRGQVHALVDISLAIAPGDFTILAGPSGSGKSTLLALLGALDRPTSGQVLFQGRSLADCSDVELARVRRRMGFIFQNFSLIPPLQVWDNISYPLIPRGVRASQRWQIAEDWLTRLGLPGKMRSYPAELSGGEQQRVALARALAGQPEIILADEPTSHLDPTSGQAVLELLREIHGAGATIILSSHDPTVTHLGTSVIELRAGKLIPQ